MSARHISKAWLQVVAGRLDSIADNDALSAAEKTMDIRQIAQLIRAVANHEAEIEEEAV